MDANLYHPCECPLRVVSRRHNESVHGQAPTFGKYAVSANWLSLVKLGYRLLTLL